MGVHALRVTAISQMGKCALKVERYFGSNIIKTVSIQMKHESNCEVFTHKWTESRL